MKFCRPLARKGTKPEGFPLNSEDGIRAFEEVDDEEYYAVVSILIKNILLCVKHAHITTKIYFSIIGRLLRLAGRVYSMRMRKFIHEKPAKRQHIRACNVERFTWFVSFEGLSAC